MSASRTAVLANAALAAALLLFAGIAVSADEEPVQEDEENVTIEEIVVYANKPGSDVDLDARYEELFRSRASTELARLDVLEEEFEWRKSSSEKADSSRIKWGYDAEAELSMRRDTSMTDFPSEENQPATLFRVQF